MPRFRRPANVPLQEWSQQDTIHIQDVTRDRIPEIITQVMEDFVRDEPICRALNYCDDAVSMAEGAEFWTDVLQDDVSIMAVDERTNRVVGFNCLAVESKDAPEEEFKCKGHALLTNLVFLKYCSKLVNVYEHYNTDKYIDGLGLSVTPTYRGKGLGLAILKARFDMCQAIGIKVTKTLFTAGQSQRLAHRLGYKVLAEVPYEEYKVEGKIVYNIKDTKSALIMGTEIPPRKQ